MKDHLVYTKPEILRAIKVAEHTTKERRKKQSGKVSKKRKLVACEFESAEEDIANHSSDESGQGNRDVLSEIEVRM